MVMVMVMVMVVVVVIIAENYLISSGILQT
jgi:hypothetical protein